MRVVFLNRFYWPDSPATAQLLTDLAGALARQGHEVIVIAGRPDAPAPLHGEPHPAVTVRRVWRTRFGNRNLLTHALDFVSYAAGAALTLLRTLRAGDVLIIMTDPPLLNVLALPLAAARGARVINWVQDIYPEAAMLLSRGRAFGWLRPVRDWAWRRAHGCVTLGSDMARLLQQAGVQPRRLHLVANWAPEGIAPLDAISTARLRESFGLAGKFVVAYFGNIGRIHDMSAVLELAEALRDEPDLVFALIGSGAQRGQLEAAARARKLESVRFFPAQPRERRSEMMALGDLHLVTLRPGGERVIFPSKLYGICAAARPLLFIGPTNSEIAEIIASCRLGVAFRREQIFEAAQRVRQLRDQPAELESFARHARTYFETEGCLERALRQWREVLRTVSEDHPAAAASR